MLARASACITNDPCPTASRIPTPRVSSRFVGYRGESARVTRDESSRGASSFQFVEHRDRISAATFVIFELPPREKECWDFTNPRGTSDFSKGEITCGSELTRNFVFARTSGRKITLLYRTFFYFYGKLTVRTNDVQVSRGLKRPRCGTEWIRRKKKEILERICNT